MSEAASVASSNFAPYDQYEVSIPMEIAGDCLHTVSVLASSTYIHIYICEHLALCDITQDVKLDGHRAVAPCMMLCMCWLCTLQMTMIVIRLRVCCFPIVPCSVSSVACSVTGPIVQKA